MKKYIFNNETYDSLWQIRNVAPNLVFSDETPEDLLKQIGIVIKEEADPEVDQEAIAKAEFEAKIAQIDMETSEAILAGFDYEINDEILHFNFDRDDQTNFESGAQGCMMRKAGIPGLPETVEWNGYRADGSLVRLVLDEDKFIGLYLAALAHKNACMQAGGKKKAALMQGTD